MDGQGKDWNGMARHGFVIGMECPGVERMALARVGKDWHGFVLRF